MKISMGVTSFEDITCKADKFDQWYRQIMPVLPTADSYPILMGKPLGYNRTMNAKSKLLLVDDEIAITDRLAPFLSRAGFEVRTYPKNN